MKRDKVAIDHSFGVGSGIQTLHSLPTGYMLARQGMPTNEKPPRPWREMLNTWNDLLEALVKIVTPNGAIGPLVAVANGKGFGGAVGLHHRIWRWMWSLPPCSMARKAAFTLGYAALLIERWRSHLQRCADGMMDRGPTEPIDRTIGQRAESLLNVLRWQIDDARGERAGRALHGAPGASIPPHEVAYGASGEWAAARKQPVDVARRILADHARRPPSGGRRRSIEEHAESFAETAIASLPDGPWTMTSEDVSRFLDMILEDT